MKQLPSSKVTSPALPHEMVRLYLDIAQCRYIYDLLTEKYNEIDILGLPDPNDFIYQMLNEFRAIAYPAHSKPLHKNESLDHYIDDIELESLNKLLSVVHHKGSSNVE